MRIVQTCWSCNNKNLFECSFGWLAPEYNLMSWALSCLQLKQFYNDVTLYADSASSKVLIEQLKLPYTEVKCTLDSLNNYDQNLWALPKIYTYNLQQFPFLHIDGDVYIWKAFDDDLLLGKLIAQNKEAASNYYESKMKTLEEHLVYFPNEIIKDRKENNTIYAYNAGIFGGSDISFFQTYTKKAFNFIDKNINHLAKINVTDFNIFFEQYLFYCMVNQQNKKVSVLIKELIGDNEYKGFGDFIEVPHNKQYLHLLGVYKKYPPVCEQLAARLRQDYPDYYYRIISLFKKKQLPLYKDYYYFLNNTSQEDLLCRFNFLRSQNDNGSQSNYALKNPAHYSVFMPDFEQTLADIVTQNFSLICRDYLYARDINCIKYFQYIFQVEQNIYSKTIVRDNFVKIINAKIDKEKTYKFSSSEIFPQIFSEENDNMYFAVIPECNKKGYTLLDIDELDILLLENLRKPLTIGELLSGIKFAFDEEDLRNSSTEFETLIFGRIKRVLEYKVIKCIIKNTDV